MAGKMLEPDSNTREIHLNSIAETMKRKSSSYLGKVNCFERNGEVKYSDCDILPNNNVCEKTVSQCYGDSEDSVTMTSVKTASNSYTGESTSDEPSQHEESDTHLLQNSEYTSRLDQIGQPIREEPESRLFGGQTCQNSNSRASKADGILYNANVSNGVKHSRSKTSRRRVNAGSSRGRPKKFMYHSQISGDKDTIKIRIKKSNLTTQLTPNKKKSGRRKRNKNPSDTDASDYESPSKRAKASSEAQNDTSNKDNQEPTEQSVWGESIPIQVLQKIFHYVCLQEGSLPMLVRLSRVCKLWRNVSLSPSLWQKADLNWVRERYRTDQKLNWLIDNRLATCQDLNLGVWKLRNIQISLEYLIEHCPELRGLNLSGWKGLNADNLKYITMECKKLERLDLSSINSTSAINAQPLVSLSQTMNSRLTHLVLAHNKLAGFTQIMSALAANCPNLQLLDISNIRTFAHNTALLHIEKLQSGCPKLRVLRITNSQIWLAPSTVAEQIASPGFPMLEELSLAGIEDDQTTTARSVDDDGIERILKNSTKLRLLDVRGCVRLTDSGLVKVPAWDLEHLFLSACYITRCQNADLELIVQKWSHSLLEVDLAWSTATASLDAAVQALAEKGDESPLNDAPTASISERTWTLLDRKKALKARFGEFNPAEAAAIKESQIKFQDIYVETELQTICNMCKVLHDAIEQLRNRALSLVESLQIVDEVQTLLRTIHDAKYNRVRECVKERFRFYHIKTNL